MAELRDKSSCAREGARGGGGGGGLRIKKLPTKRSRMCEGTNKEKGIYSLPVGDAAQKIPHPPIPKIQNTYVLQPIQGAGGKEKME